MTLMTKRFLMATILFMMAITLFWQVASVMKSDMSPLKTIVSTESAVQIQHQQTIMTDAMNTKPRKRERLYLDMVERYRFAKLQHQLLQEQLAIANIEQQIGTIRQHSGITAGDYDPLLAVKADKPTHPRIEAKNPALAEEETRKKPNNLDEAVLLAMPGSSYTIKLRSSANREELVNFARQHKMSGRTLCYAKSEDRKKVYTLLYGDYLTETAAISALASLPQAVNPAEVSIEKLDDIQKMLKTD